MPPRAASSGWSLFRSRWNESPAQGRGVGERARSALFTYAKKVGKPAHEVMPGRATQARATGVSRGARGRARGRPRGTVAGASKHSRRRPPLREARCCDRVRKGATGPVRPSRRPQSDRLATQSEAVPRRPPEAAPWTIHPAGRPKRRRRPAPPRRRERARALGEPLDGRDRGAGCGGRCARRRRGVPGASRNCHGAFTVTQLSSSAGGASAGAASSSRNRVLKRPSSGSAVPSANSARGSPASARRPRAISRSAFTTRKPATSRSASRYPGPRKSKQRRRNWRRVRRRRPREADAPAQRSASGARSSVGRFPKHGRS